MQLLGQELQEVLQGKVPLSPVLAKLVLTQITLNGLLFKKYDLEKLNPLLDTIRRVIVETEGKCRSGKAYLMLALDLYYSHFTAQAMLSLQKVYGAYLDDEKVKEEEQRNTFPVIDHFAEDPALVSPPRKSAATDAATNTSLKEDQPTPEKRQRVEIAVQTEVAICDVFKAGPTVATPLERASNATTCTNLSMSRDDNSSKAMPTSPTATTDSSGTRKSKIDPRIRNVKMGRVYPSPTLGTKLTPSPPRPLKSTTTMSVKSNNSSSGSKEMVGQLSIKNVTLHELAMMKENPSHLNRITNGYLDRLAPPSDTRCPSIKSSSEYTGKENENDRMSSGKGCGESVKNGGSPSKKHQQQQSSPQQQQPQQQKHPQQSIQNNHNNNGNKFQIEENYDTITYDASYFDDYVPNGHAKSFLQFLGNK